MSEVLLTSRATLGNPNRIDCDVVHQAEGAHKQVVKMLSALEFVEMEILWGLYDRKNALKEGDSLLGRINLNFSVQLQESQRQSGLEAISYHFSEAAIFKRIGEDTLKYPTLHDSDITFLKGYVLVRSDASFGVTLNYNENDGPKRYMRATGEMNIAASNFRQALKMPLHIASPEFLQRMADIARVNGATKATQLKFDRAVQAFTT